MRHKVIMAVLAMTLVAGCAATKQEQGTVMGGAVGVALGSMIGDGSGRTAAMILGGLFGATAGSNIGAQLDERDKLLMTRTSQNALEYGRDNETKHWENPNTRHSGTVTPTSVYRTDRGNTVCRDFTQTIYIDGKREIGNGRACRNRQGQWIVQ